MDVGRADGRRDRGVVDVAVVEPRETKFGGGGRLNETTINCKRGGCIVVAVVVVVVVKGEGRRMEVTSSLSSHEGDGVGKRSGGGGTAMIVAGGEAVSLLSSWMSNGLGKDPGERGATIDDDVTRSLVPPSSTSVMRWLMAASKDFISFCKSAEK
jgi:hypothetical protein